MSHEIQAPDSKAGKTTREKVAEVDALLSVFPEIGASRACRRVGIPRETYYWWRRKLRSASVGAPSDEIPGETPEAA